jgi:selenide,water dikinase
LSKLPKFADPNLLVGIETSDDAAIYKVTDEIAMIQTVDFFTPIVDDPYWFGQIAAANSLSDVWAMGGEPVVALNIVGFPNCLDPSILGEILKGGADKVKEAGAVLVGGHSVQDDEPKYGLCVSGFVHPDKIFRNYGCKEGDVLILTKQIGSGVINTAAKGNMADSSSIDEATKVMSSLNRTAKRVIENFPANACTDITGFGLLGHCAEMAQASDVTLEINVSKVPLIANAYDYALMGLVPGGTYKNQEYSGGIIDSGNTKEVYLDLLFDPQTSGGLLVSIPEENASDVIKSFEKSDIDTKVAVIGRVLPKEAKLIKLR